MLELVRGVTISSWQLPQKGFPKQAPGRDRDRATAAFWWCNRKLIETINMVLIIKAQVLRRHFADCFAVGLTYIHKKENFNLLFGKTYSRRAQIQFN